MPVDGSNGLVYSICQSTQASGLMALDRLVAVHLVSSKVDKNVYPCNCFLIITILINLKAMRSKSKWLQLIRIT